MSEEAPVTLMDVLRQNGEEHLYDRIMELIMTGDLEDEDDDGAEQQEEEARDARKEKRTTSKRAATIAADKRSTDPSTSASSK
ncbi:hypothetical protein PINS_up013448 [Pythium insidiosum]|nr:hypothetical protein PINS_up013448 [Pythium insidiosum]